LVGSTRDGNLNMVADYETNASPPPRGHFASLITEHVTTLSVKLNLGFKHFGIPIMYMGDNIYLYAEAAAR
jgi:hypothetical protein